VSRYQASALVATGTLLIALACAVAICEYADHLTVLEQRTDALQRADSLDAARAAAGVVH
jgi:hypothetical protein